MKRATWALVLLVLVVPLGTALGGWLDGIARIGKATRRPATQGVYALEQATALVSKLPVRPDRIPLALSASHEGHWRLVNGAGETMTAAGADELSRAIQVLTPQRTQQPGQRLALYLAEDTPFTHRALLQELPKQADLFVVVGHDAFPLYRKGEAITAPLYVEAHPRILVEIAARETFDEALWQLARPLSRADLRVIGLEPGGPAVLSSVPKFDSATRRPLADTIAPDRLRHALPSLRGQTVLVTGRVDGELLYFKPPSGPERSLILTDITSAAQTADVNLIVLRSSSPRQPGARNWLWQKVEVEYLDAAIGKETMADFMAALRGEDGRMIVAAVPRGRLSVDIEARPAFGLAGEASGNPVSATVSEMLAEVTAKVLVHGVTATMRHSDRQRELDERLIPGIPAVVQHYVLGSILLGLLALSMSRRWWNRIWPPEVAAEYASPIGYRAAAATRQLAFFAFFLSLAGPLIFLASIVERVLGTVRRITRGAPRMAEIEEKAR